MKIECFFIENYNFIFPCPINIIYFIDKTNQNIWRSRHFLRPTCRNYFQSSYVHKCLLLSSIKKMFYFKGLNQTPTFTSNMLLFLDVGRDCYPNYADDTVQKSVTGWLRHSTDRLYSQIQEQKMLD